ncbi:MFS transporter [Olivibacter sitiensis]|uniref:MFS transporter n=1 Tax=Olivibacter sitiensis TaxID=376470 RepID=UPI00041F37D1|nr:MFS transporter [Olivibacter sitiensis]
MQNTWKKTFAIIWGGQFISLLSSSAVNFAVIIWLSLETESAEVLAAAAIAGLLPQALLGPLAGVYIDRWDRKKTMMLADGFIALCTLAMSITFYMGQFQLWFIYLLLGLRSVGSAFHMPAMQASIPLLAPESELLRIAGINQSIQSVSNIAGPALGALLIGLFEIGYVLLADVIGAIVAISTLLFVKIPRPEPNKSLSNGVRQVIQDLAIGIQAISKKRGLSYLFLFSILATFCIMPVAVLFPLLTLQHFEGGTFHMSVIEIIWGVGMLIGGAFLGVFKPNISKVVLINSMHLLLGATLAISGVLPSWAFVIFVGLTAIGGMAASIYNASFTTILQEEIDPSMLGRVFSMFFSIAILPSIIGLLSTGFLADHIGIARTFVILGSAISVIGLISFLVPDLMKLGSKDTKDNTDTSHI